MSKFVEVASNALPEWDERQRARLRKFSEKISHMKADKPKKNNNATTEEKK